MKIRIGTRRSQLAMWQTQTVAGKLTQLFPDLSVDIIPIQTLGDKDRNTALNAFNRTGVFTKEIEDALLSNKCDLAVHSFKDLATTLPDGLMIGAVLEREDPRDVFISRTGTRFEDLPEGALIGTSSLRRRAMILHNRDDLKLSHLRGNVPTRLKAAGAPIEDGKEPEGPQLDGTILAYAGIKRLGLEQHITQVLETNLFLPAPAQGTIAVQIREGDKHAADAVNALNHVPTQNAVMAERKFLQVMEGGCQLPIGALAQMKGNQVELKGMVLNLDGSRFSYGMSTGSHPKTVGMMLAEDLKRRGGNDILKDVNETLAKQSKDSDQ